MRTRVPLAAITLFLIAATAGADWRPRDPNATQSGRVTSLRGFSDPVAQQMRNFRDLRRVDAFRGDPTPTPTPAPSNQATGEKFVFVSFPDSNSFDRTPPHPLADYFSEVGESYRAYGFGRLGKLLKKKAGRVVETLFTGRGPHPARSARNFSRNLAAEVRRSTDEPWLDRVGNFISSASFPDYRGLALALADNLRRAAKNVSRHRQASAGIRPRTPLALSIQRAAGILTLSRSDGYGGNLTLRKNDVTGATTIQGTYSSSLALSDTALLAWLSGTGSISIPTPVSSPSPSPTPAP